MNPSTVLLISELLRIFLRGYTELLAQSNMTEEEKEAHFKALSDTFAEYAPDNLTPAP